VCCSTPPATPFASVGTTVSAGSLASKTQDGDPTKTGRECGAGEGNRTLIASLEGWCSAIELHPQTVNCIGSRLFVLGLPTCPIAFLQPALCYLPVEPLAVGGVARRSIVTESGSGRPDSNRRPRRPKRRALTKLRYAP
jgi:hypothetical protein